MEQEILPVDPESARKRKSQPEKWKRNTEERKKYSAKGLPNYPTCNHRVGFQCTLLTMRDVKDFHAAFNSIPEKGKQDSFILKYCRAEQPNPRRKVKLPVKGKSTIYEYTIVNQAGNNLKVCRNTFLNVLNITKHRVIGVFTKFKKGINHVPVETRGGNHKEAKFASKREAVMSFIGSLKACESHYAREKSTRIYLPSELSVKKLWTMFNNDKPDNEQVTECFFRKVFCVNFNIGFSAPAVDECSTCIELTQRISIEKNDAQKSELQFKLKLHKKQANRFFDHLREKPPGCAIFSFDCQKNLVLPKVSDQIAYYTRQLYCYNLSVVRGLSTDSLKRDNVSIYSWTENEAKKSSSEVASIVYNELTTTDLSDCNSIRLVTDGCAGQNKNVIVVTMCMKWLATDAPESIKDLEIIYPVTGHSFMPADRVFGLLEKEFKKKQNFICKEEYHEIFKKYGKLKLVEKDWKLLNWREQAIQHVKSASQLHFQISKCRRIILRKTKSGNVTVRGEIGYGLLTGRERPIIKVNHSIADINPTVMSVGVPLKPEKLTDVAKLLEKHFGNNWRSLETLQWYVNVIDADSGFQDENTANNNECECIELQDNDNVDDGRIVTIHLNN